MFLRFCTSLTSLKNTSLERESLLSRCYVRVWFSLHSEIFGLSPCFVPSIFSIRDSPTYLFSRNLLWVFSCQDQIGGHPSESPCRQRHNWGRGETFFSTTYVTYVQTTSEILFLSRCHSVIDDYDVDTGTLVDMTIRRRCFNGDTVHLTIVVLILLL